MTSRLRVKFRGVRCRRCVIGLARSLGPIRGMRLGLTMVVRLGPAPVMMTSLTVVLFLRACSVRCDYVKVRGLALLAWLRALVDLLMQVRLVMSWGLIWCRYVTWVRLSWPAV